MVYVNKNLFIHDFISRLKDILINEIGKYRKINESDIKTIMIWTESIKIIVNKKSIISTKNIIR